MINNYFKSLFPDFIKPYIAIWFERYLVKEIQNLRIHDMGYSDDGFPWVHLFEGPIFYGFLPNKYQCHLFQGFCKKLPHIDKDHFAVVSDIVSRYQIPRSIPGETVFRPSKYKPIRDPLNDFRFSINKRKQLAALFRPKLGETFVDIGAYIGYGTMRVAELVGNNGRVVAFESEPNILSLLRRNIVENNINNVTIIPKAVANNDGEGTFFRSSGTVNSLSQGVLNNLGFDDLKPIKVDIQTVDSALNNLSITKVDMVNITINGGEYDALIGMQNTLQNSDKVRITLAGWYRLTGKKKVCDLVEPWLRENDFIVMTGRIGRVLALKNTYPTI